MQEIELKFLVPQSRLKGLMRQAKTKASQTMQMSAHYYDTPEQDLAKRGIGLRIRKEGDEWVQTIKAGGDGLAARLEHNAPLDAEHVQAMLEANALMPDLTIYKHTSIADALADFKLKKLAKKLTRQYIADVERTTRLLTDDNYEEGKSDKDEEKNLIEVAYDYGEIIHGTDSSQRQPLQEIEFELVSGDVEFLFATAKIWCKRYKLCLSTVTKAERGGLLINKQAYSPAVKADLEQLSFDKHISMPAFVRATVHNCLLQILPDSSAIIAGSDANEHILQLRIGIRRLRTAIKAFKTFSDEMNPDWLPILKQTETLLGNYRQLTYLASNIEPSLQKNGAPVVDWCKNVEHIEVTPINAVRANDFQLTLLELIAFVMSDPSIDTNANKPVMTDIPHILSKQHKKLLKAEQRLADIYERVNENEIAQDDADSGNVGSGYVDSAMSNDNTKQEALHNLRNQIKELRYVSEFCAPLYSKKKTKRWLKCLTKAQTALGDYLDNTFYQQSYQQKSATDSNALYGAGWFAAMQKRKYQRAIKRLNKVKDSSLFW